jgi:hypothetical protein
VTLQSLSGCSPASWTACHRAPTFFERGGLEPEIDHFVMASQRPKPQSGIPLSIERLELAHVWTADMLCAWLCIGTACAGFFAGGLLVLLAARLPSDKHTAL